MPLYDEYAEAIKSQVADVKNTGGRYGGIGTSAKFIEHFTEGYPWAHVDMASMGLAEDDKPAQPKGATGTGCGCSRRSWKDSAASVRTSSGRDRMLGKDGGQGESLSGPRLHPGSV